MLIVSCPASSKKSLGPFLYSHHQVFIYTHAYDFRKYFLVHAEEFQIFQPLFMRWRVQAQAHNLLCAPSLICCRAHLCLSFTGEPSTGPSIQMCFSRAKERRRVTSLHLLVELCLMQPKMLSALFHEGILLAHGELSGSCPKYFTVNLPSSQSNPSLYRYLGLFFPKCKSLHYEFLKVFLCQFLKPDND